MRKVLILVLFASLIVIWVKIATRLFFDNAEGHNQMNRVHSSRRDRRFVDLRLDSLHTIFGNPFDKGRAFSFSNDQIQERQIEKKVEIRNDQRQENVVVRSLDYDIDYLGFVKKSSKQEVKGIFKVLGYSKLCSVGDSIKDFKVIFIDEKKAILESSLFGQQEVYK